MVASDIGVDLGNEIDDVWEGEFCLLHPNFNVRQSIRRAPLTDQPRGISPLFAIHPLAKSGVRRSDGHHARA